MSACGYKFYLQVFNYTSLRYRVEHETRIKFVSRSGHVIFCLLCTDRSRDAVMLFSYWLRLKWP